MSHPYPLVLREEAQPLCYPKLREVPKFRDLDVDQRPDPEA